MPFTPIAILNDVRSGDLDKSSAIELLITIIDNSENITFPVNNVILLKDNYEFNNAVLNFFIAGITEKANEKTTTR